MFSSTCPGLQLRLVDARFERGCVVLPVPPVPPLAESSVPCTNGCSSGLLVGTAELPSSSTCTHTVAASLQGFPTIWKSSAAFRIGLSQLQLLGEGEAHLLSRALIFTMQVTVLMLLGKIEKIHEVHGVRLQGDWIKAEPLPFLGGWTKQICK